MGKQIDNGLAGVLRHFAKTLARIVSLVLVLPVLLFYWIEASLVGRDRSLEDSTEALGMLPGLPGRYLRRAFLGCVLENCHPSAHIGFGTIFSKRNCSIGANVYIGPRCHLGLVTLEDNVLLAAGVHVTSGGHNHGIADQGKPIREQEGILRRVRIGAGSWIGSAAIVMADVGCDSIVGAGAVVTRPLPAGVLAVGVPARVIRYRTAST